MKITQLFPHGSNSGSRSLNPKHRAVSGSMVVTDPADVADIRASFRVTTSGILASTDAKDVFASTGTLQAGYLAAVEAKDVFAAAASGPGLDMDFVNHTYSGAVVADLTVSRALAAYAPTSTGSLTLFSTNVPRITNKGLLIEESRANLLLQSNAFTNAAWSAVNGASVTTSAVTGPDGSTNGFKVSLSASATSQIKQSITVPNGTLFVASVYARVTTTTVKYFRLKYYDGTTQNYSQDYPVKNGWQRFAWTFVGTGVAGDISVCCGNSGAAAGDIYIWGGQAEAGQFETSYIPTTTVAVTRPADLVSLTGSKFTAVYTGGSSGTMYADFVKSAAFIPNFGRMFSANDGTNTNEISFAVAAYAQNYLAGINRANDFAVQLTSANVPSGVEIKAAMAYAPSDVAFSDSGRTVQTSAAEATVPTPTQFNIGSDPSGGSVLSGFVRRVVYFPSRLANASLQALSTPIFVPDATNYTFGNYLLYLAGWGANSLVVNADYSNIAYVNPAQWPNNILINSTWPSATPLNGVYGYMALTYGNYNSGIPETAVTPKQISAISSFTTSWNVGSFVGDFDGLMEFYTTLNSGDAFSRTAEIGFFFHTNASTSSYFASVQQFGTVTISGVTWKVARDFGGDAGNFVMFMPTDERNITSITLDLKAAIAFCVSNGLTSNSNYVNGAGIGIEPHTSASSLTINSWSCSLT